MSKNQAIYIIYQEYTCTYPLCLRNTPAPIHSVPVSSLVLVVLVRKIRTADSFSGRQTYSTHLHRHTLLLFQILSLRYYNSSFRRAAVTKTLLASSLETELDPARIK